jgi:hypothetical protein
LDRAAVFAFGLQFGLKVAVHVQQGLMLFRRQALRDALDAENQD